jgi:hypothetical protein
LGECELKTWENDDALNTIIDLTTEADRLRSARAFSTEHVIWVTKCLELFEEVFGRKSRYYLSFAHLDWRMASGTIIDPLDYGGDYQAGIDAKHHEAYLRQLGIAKGLLLAANDYLSKREMKDVKERTDASVVLKVLNLAEHKLRKVIIDRPEREKQIQDAFESLLIGADISYGREVDSIEYSSKTYKPDFSLPEINLAVEFKLCGQEQREKELPKEINDDILAYKTKYQNLIFIIYDLGHIRDKDRFSGSFEKYENVMVRVVKH